MNTMNRCGRILIASALLGILSSAVAEAQDIINISPQLTQQQQDERVRLEEKKQYKKSVKGEILRNQNDSTWKKSEKYGY